MQAGAEDGGPWKWTSEKKWFWPRGSPARDLDHEQEHESYPRFTFLRHLSILELREQVCSLLVRPLGFCTKMLIIYFGKTLSLGSPNLWNHIGMHTRTDTHTHTHTPHSCICNLRLPSDFFLLIKKLFYFLQKPKSRVEVIKLSGPVQIIFPLNHNFTKTSSLSYIKYKADWKECPTP